MAPSPNYGIDAPGVIRNLAIAGAVVVLLSVAFPVIVIGPLNLKISGLAWSGASLLAVAALMLLYSKAGKFRHARRMIRVAQLKGHEQVLDVGTGRGLLLVEAAKHLTTGRAIGIDIWNAADLSGNLRANTEANLTLEGVAERCELRDEPAQQMTFTDSSFDVVVSNMCLHNIEPASARAAACREIARVLKPGGLALISDYKNSGSYARIFRQAGLDTSRKIYLFDTFPPVIVVHARKPLEGTDAEVDRSFRAKRDSEDPQRS